MATTFVVEDGTGKSNANAYIDEASADQYWENHSDPSEWSGATSVVKENAIRMATQYLDSVYHKRWLGQKNAYENALDFPRLNIVTDEDYLLPSDEIPQALKDACCELAYRHLTETDGLLPDLDDPGSVRAYSVKAGPVSESTTYEGGKGEYKNYTIVDKLLADLIESNTTLVRG